MTLQNPRRTFIKKSIYATGATVAGTLFSSKLTGKNLFSNKVPLSGHLWVYASQFPPNWDCTPILEQVFSDFEYAGLEGVELMEVNLRHDDVVHRISAFIQKYGVPVSGTSYSADMWDRTQHQKIVEDVKLVADRLGQLGGSTFGITVGNADRMKTEAELDAQAEVLKRVMEICDQHKIQPNLHNHTFEVVNDLHDLKGTLDRVPALKLGPDLNWLIRGGVDPVEFIHTYGDRMVYMHLRDQDAEGKWTRAVGEGVTDFPAIAKALKDVNFSGRAAVELAFEKPPANEVKDDWKKSREYVKKVFGW